MIQTDRCKLMRGEASTARRLLGDFAFFGHYLHIHAGGRSGKQFVLCTLLDAGGTMSQRELLDRACISSAALSEVLAKLDSAGLLVRARSEVDRRQLTLALTPEGEVQARELRREIGAFESMAFSCLTEDETHELLAALDRVRENWNEIEEGKKVSQCQS